jgi:hypothetical protein
MQSFHYFTVESKFKSINLVNTLNKGAHGNAIISPQRPDSAPNICSSQNGMKARFFSSILVFPPVLFPLMLMAPAVSYFSVCPQRFMPDLELHYDSYIRNFNQGLVDFQ